MNLRRVGDVKVVAGSLHNWSSVYQHTTASLRAQHSPLTTASSLYTKRGKVSARPYVRTYVRDVGRDQLSSEWRHNENDVIMRTGAASAAT